MFSVLLKILSCQSVPPKSFPQSACPTLRYILPEFSCSSPLRRFIRTKFPTNCEAHLAESFFQTRSSGKTAGYKTLTHNTTAKHNKTDMYNKKDLFITFIKKNL